MPHGFWPGCTWSSLSGLGNCATESRAESSELLSRGIYYIELSFNYLSFHISERWYNQFYRKFDVKTTDRARTRVKSTTIGRLYQPISPDAKRNATVNLEMLLAMLFVIIHRNYHRAISNANRMKRFLLLQRTTHVVCSGLALLVEQVLVLLLTLIFQTRVCVCYLYFVEKPFFTSLFTSVRYIMWWWVYILVLWRSCTMQRWTIDLLTTWWRIKKKKNFFWCTKKH